jgi:uncharacterized protein YegP (UPF0339 family)
VSIVELSGFPMLQRHHDRVRKGTEVHVMKFVMKKTSNNQFRFNLVASNGQVVATSETYTRKASALDTIESMRKNVASATIDDQTAAA